MKIPKRIHCEHPLPGDAVWVITERHGQLIVYLAHDVPPDSPLEQLFVRQAVRAWQQRHNRALSLLPILAAGSAGLRWLTNQARRPAVAAGTAVVTAAGVALAAATLTDPPRHPMLHRPPAAEAPPSQSPARTPSPPRSTKPHPRPSTPPARPRPPAAGLDTSASVAVTGVGRVRVPPVRERPPVTVPTPPVAVPTPPRPVVSRCRLVRVEVGELVRVCL